MSQLPTDRTILRCIFDAHYADYPSKGDPYVPIDLYGIATKLRCTPEILHGRLLYDMGTRWESRDPADVKMVRVSILAKRIGEELHVVHFPYLVGILAGLDEQRRRDLWAVGLSIFATAVAIGAAIAQIIAS